ncbi:allantoate deiminase [Alteromonas sp. 76-1]|jgi:allantoate deiminase|uniref:allantoate amidohydrolase n=1 Tax=Alteromonas TaxID=226 RepID=UPI000C5C1366|nr:MULTISPECIES: allantoate amidohydrolase [Alteromonas]MBB67881.1 allantoate amidohydrolase [Rickettsiales bacterium]MCQ8847253.1 allantoate amidohydrolase [Alteromonas stellipolaris]VEL96529.1 allantoate deiminase [Alteromonas sp. 76-1]
MSEFSDAAALVMARCEALGSLSQNPSCLDRRYLTEQHKLANQLTSGWMIEAGMTTWQDSVGNIWGRYTSAVPNAPRLIIGSHLDTVPNGGKYDGMLGVVAPVTLMAMFSGEGRQFPFHIDIVGFCDEEGTRFGTTLLGSRALTGKWQDEWRRLKDEDGISLEDAMKHFGLDFDAINSATIAQTDLLGYLELHIEQGPVLEQENLPVGVVNAIAGAKRFSLTVTGMAGHAGTVPMSMRHDALCASAEMILAVESISQQRPGVVATVGKIENAPNGVNVISGRCQFSLDIRSEEDPLRDAALAEILQKINDIAVLRNVELKIEQTHSAPAVHCDSALQNTLLKGVTEAGIVPKVLASGAGHDAMAMAEICPVAMLFTRCKGGISHHPAESITTEDVAASLAVMHHSLSTLKY